MVKLLNTFLALLSTIFAGVAGDVAAQVGAPSAELLPSATTPAPTSAPCTPLLFDQRQYLLKTTESYVGVLTVLIPAAGAGVIGYNVRTPGYESSLIFNNVTGILQKAGKMDHQRVQLLVQGETANSEKKHATNSTDIVDVDETLIIIDVVDENDSPPVLDCSPYGGRCDDLVVGFPASPTAALPVPLLRLTSSDGDTGPYGATGIRFSVNSSAFSVDPSGLLSLIDSSVCDQQHVKITAEDNFGQQPSLQAQAFLTTVPVTDGQLFYVSADRQLADTDDVTELLEDIRAAGGFNAVLSFEFQDINYGSQVSGSHDNPGNGTSQLYVYAISRNDDWSYRVVDADEFQRALEKMPDSGRVRYIENREDQMHKEENDDQMTVTGLIVALVVVSCLLVIVIVIAVFRERNFRQLSGSP